MPIETRNISSDRSSFDPEDNVQGNKSNVNSENTFKSSSAEVRPDEVTTEQRDLLSPKKGEVIFNIDSGVNEEWNGTEWISSSGGDSSLNKQGFIDYNDTTGEINLTSDTWTTIPNNGAGAFSNSTYSPEGVSELMNVSNGTIDVSDLELGDSIFIRNDFKINPNTNNALAEFRYRLGGGGSQYTLETTLGRLDNGSGVDYRFSLKPDLIYMGDTNTRDNPIVLEVKLSTDGTITNAGSVIQLIKAKS
jgi:hypothetical protein